MVMGDIDASAVILMAEGFVISGLVWYNNGMMSHERRGGEVFTV